MRPITQALAIAGVSAVALATFAGTALAEPTSTPADTSIVAVGSDTIQYLADQFQSDAVGTANNFFSYDAISNSGTALSSTITAKQGCAAITRPTSSGSGISALAANALTGDTSDGPAGTYCIDIARASRVANGGTTPDPTGLAFVPIAGDAITYSREQSTNVPSNLTVAELTAIYSCNDSALGGSGDPVTENEIGGIGTDAVAPVLPQTSSGTRATFLNAIGLGAGTAGPGSCVTQANSDGTVIEENEGTNEVFSARSNVDGLNTKDIVFPYSIGVYLNQTEKGNGSGINEPGSLNLESIAGKAPTTGKGSKMVIDKKFPIQRQLYFVTRRTSAKPYIPTYLQTFLGADNDKGAVCSKTALKDDTGAAFLSLGSKCGVLTSADLT
jgi:ABC-type phosphate transport system substrate-binding protein